MYHRIIEEYSWQCFDMSHLKMEHYFNSAGTSLIHQGNSTSSLHICLQQVVVFSFFPGFAVDVALSRSKSILLISVFGNLVFEFLEDLGELGSLPLPRFWRMGGFGGVLPLGG